MSENSVGDLLILAAEVIAEAHGLVLTVNELMSPKSAPCILRRKFLRSRRPLADVSRTADRRFSPPNESGAALDSP